MCSQAVDHPPIDCMVLSGGGAKGSDAAFKYCGVTFTEGQRHTALGDVRATASLLTRLVEMEKP